MYSNIIFKIKDEAVNESTMSYKKGLVPEIWEEMQMEPPLPIYLKVTSHDEYFLKL